jgi:hypothetical protein
MTSTKTKPQEEVPPAGTRFDYPPSSPYARCEVCRQPSTPLFQTTPDTHRIEQSGGLVPARVYARCWSKYHVDADDVCPHCGKDTTEEPLW